MKLQLSKMNISDPPAVSIIILNWNNWQDTVQCLESLYQIDYSNYQVIVVDNGSTDDSVLQLKQRFNPINLFETGRNLGFSGGVNFGIEQAKTSDLILLLNNDTIVAKNFLTELVRKITSDDTIGLVGGKIYYYEAAERDAFMHRTKQSIKGLHYNKNKIWSAGGGISKFTKRTFHFGEKKSDRGQYDQEREVDFLSGCCLLIKREVIEKIGLLDSDYFMYYEDVDFCLRAKKRHYKIIYSPQAVIWHKVSGSSLRSSIDYYRMRNYLLLQKKQYNYNIYKILLLGVIASIERILRIVSRKIILGYHEKVIIRLRYLIKGFKEGLFFKT
jgi:GT2 family glycosyltransferase